MTTLLEVTDLALGFSGEGQDRLVVDGVSLRLDAGECLALVGESGSGKSVTALAVMRLLSPQARIRSGVIRLKGEDLLALPEHRMESVRGRRIGMVFQDPMSALNPVMTIGHQLLEAIRGDGHTPLSAKTKALSLLDQVGLPDPSKQFLAYPHQLSGGMRQRVLIAQALAGDPDLLIADEPTTALDVTIQAQILELIRSLQAKQGTAVILITHDLGVVAELCDEIAVMYAGQIVEKGPVDLIFNAPQHPYTVGLLGSLPRLEHRQERLAAIEGQVPDMTKLQTGCRFADRCPFVLAQCRTQPIALQPVSDRQASRCLRIPLERLVA